MLPAPVLPDTVTETNWMPLISHLRRDLFCFAVLLGSLAEILGRSSGERRYVCPQIAALCLWRDIALGRRAVGFKACRK